MSAATSGRSFYAGGRSRWSGKPNVSLVDEVAGLEPGDGARPRLRLRAATRSGLAAQGWTVTAADISQTALDVAAGHAAEAGVEVTWERHDLAVSQPAGRFDLVTASFLHSEVELPARAVLRAAAGAVAPGGTLLIVGHAPSAEHHHATTFPAPDRSSPSWRCPRTGGSCRRASSASAARLPRRAAEGRIDTVVRFRRR